MKSKVFIIVSAMLCILQAFAQVNLEWLARYESPAAGEDVGNAIAVDSSGNVYVAGYTRVSSWGTGDYLTIKYRPDGTLAWVRTYDGQGNSEDIAYAIAVGQCVRNRTERGHGHRR
jgi:hypothetical protein